jgi:hypothetical protein
MEDKNRLGKKKVAVNDYRNWLEKSWRGVALGGGLL